MYAGPDALGKFRCGDRVLKKLSCSRHPFLFFCAGGGGGGGVVFFFGCFWLFLGFLGCLGVLGCFVWGGFWVFLDLVITFDQVACCQADGLDSEGGEALNPKP